MDDKVLENQKSGKYTIESVAQALRILRLFSDGNRALTISDISESCDITKSRAFRMLKTLELEYFVRYDSETRKYSLDIAVYDLCVNGFEFLAIQDSLRPILDRAANKSGLIVHLTIIKQGVLRLVYRVWPEHEDVFGLISPTPVGRAISIHCTGAGKILYAYSDIDEQKAMLENCEFETYSERTITSSEEFIQQAREAKAHGYAINDGEHESYLKCITYPVFNRNGRVVAALSVSGLREMFTDEVTNSSHAILKEVVEEIRSIWVGV